MGGAPLEPKAWDGRWLAIVFHRPESAQDKASYALDEVQRAATHYDAALLARDRWSLPVGTHLMIVPLPAEISKVAEPLAVEPEVPAPRWYRVDATYPQQISEDEWLREVRAQWYTPPAAA